MRATLMDVLSRAWAMSIPVCHAASTFDIVIKISDYNVQFQFNIRMLIVVVKA